MIVFLQVNNLFSSPVRKGDRDNLFFCKLIVFYRNLEILIKKFLIKFCSSSIDKICSISVYYLIFRLYFFN